MSLKKRRWSIISLLVVFVLLLAACSGATAEEPAAGEAPSAETEAEESSTETEEEASAAETEAEESEAEESTELVPINLRLSWLVKGEYAHLFAAQELGYFEEEGIDINILEGVSGATPTQRLMSGDDHFAYIPAEDVARSTAAGMSLVSVATFLQKHPMAVAALAPKENDGPEDLVGQRVVDTPDGIVTMVWDGLLEANGLSPDDAEIQIADWGAHTTMLFEGDADMTAGYLTNDIPVIELTHDVDLNYWLISEHGFNMLAHGLVTSKEFAANNPEIVAGMVRAVQRGTKYTAENPVEAAELIAGLFPDELEEDITIQQVQETVKLFHTENTADQPYGWAAPEDWENTIAILDERGGLESRLEDSSEYFTNDFVDMTIE